MSQSNQEDLCDILPRLHDDLINNDVSTLARYVVRRSYQVHAPQGELEEIIVKRLCQNSAKKLKLQCGREYFPDNELPLRATRIISLSANEKEGLPVDNLIVERDFSSFDRRSKIAKCGNRKFTGANIRNNMVLLHADPTLTNDAKQVIRPLSERYDTWVRQQKILKEENNQLKQNKKRTTKLYQDRVLTKCKTWNGPCTSVPELERALQLANDENECVTQELTYYRLTHAVEFKQNRQLYRVRGISYQEKYENLRSILSDEEDLQEKRLTVGKLPSNADILKSLKEHEPNANQAQPDQPQRPDYIVLHNLVVTMWIGKKGNVWYTGFITDTCEDNQDADHVIVDHLHPLDDKFKNWKYPSKKDEGRVDIEQVLALKPKYDWDFSGRDPILKLLNYNEITAQVKKTNLTP